MTTYDLYKLRKKKLQNGSHDLVIRQTGKIIRDQIEINIKKEKNGAIIALDFSNVGIIDYSCADEIVAKLISRLLSGEYGNKYIILTGLNENQKENIEVALERKRLAVMAEVNGKKLLIGELNNYLRQTLDFILKKGLVTAKELSEALGIEMNTSGTRLLNLHKKRLVKRTDEIRNGGRVWVYKMI